MSVEGWGSHVSIVFSAVELIRSIYRILDSTCSQRKSKRVRGLITNISGTINTSRKIFSCSLTLKNASFGKLVCTSTTFHTIGWMLYTCICGISNSLGIIKLSYRMRNRGELLLSHDATKYKLRGACSLRDRVCLCFARD